MDPGPAHISAIRPRHAGWSARPSNGSNRKHRLGRCDNQLHASRFQRRQADHLLHGDFRSRGKRRLHKNSTSITMTGLKIGTQSYVYGNGEN